MVYIIMYAWIPGLYIEELFEVKDSRLKFYCSV